VHSGFIYGCLLAMGMLTGCSADRPRNASFDLTTAQANAVLREMQAHPRPLQRPVIVLGGYLDPGLGVDQLARRLRDVVDDVGVISVGFVFCRDFDECRQRVIEVIEEHYPSDDPDWTTQVDVVAISMGGLVARYAAMPPTKDDEDAASKRLNIARLYTISTPHQGAQMAELPTVDRVQIAMRADSDFLQQIDPVDDFYELYCYVRLNDVTIGAENAAPRGSNPWWVATPFLSPSHIGAGSDPRIVADIARRLRGEPPFTTTPPTPLPH